MKDRAIMECAVEAYKPIEEKPREISPLDRAVNIVVSLVGEDNGLYTRSKLTLLTRIKYGGEIPLEFWNARLAVDVAEVTTKKFMKANWASQAKSSSR